MNRSAPPSDAGAAVVTGSSSTARPNSFELDERMREEQHAATVIMVLNCQHSVGQMANLWLKVAETQGALSNRAKRVSCLYSLALDASKTGKLSVE